MEYKYHINSEYNEQNRVHNCTECEIGVKSEYGCIIYNSEFSKKCNYKEVDVSNLKESYNGLFSSKKNECIISLTNICSILNSQAAISMKGGSISQKESNEISLPETVIKRLNQISHLMFNFGEKDIDEGEDIYEEDFDEDDSHELKILSLECLSLLAINDLNIEILDKYSVIDTFIYNISLEPSIIGLTFLSMHSIDNRNRILSLNVAGKMLNFVRSSISNGNVKCSTFCSFLNSIFKYSESEGDGFKECIDLVFMLSSLWETVSTADKSCIINTFCIILKFQDSFDNTDELIQISNNILNFCNIKSTEYVKKCCTFFVLLLDKNELFSPVKRFIVENGLKDMIIKLVESINEQQMPIKAVAPLIEKYFNYMKEEAIINKTWESLENMFYSCPYVIQKSIIIAIADVTLSVKEDSILNELSKDDKAFGIICYLYPEPELNFFVIVVQALCRLAHSATIHSNPSINEFITTNEDFIKWINDAYEVTTNKSFGDGKDTELLEKINKGIEQFLVIVEED